MRPYDGPMTGANTEAALWFAAATAKPMCQPGESRRFHSMAVLSNMPTTALLDDFGKNAAE